MRARLVLLQLGQQRLLDLAQPLRMVHVPHARLQAGLEQRDGLAEDVHRGAAVQVPHIHRAARLGGDGEDAPEVELLVPRQAAQVELLAAQVVLDCDVPTDGPGKSNLFDITVLLLLLLLLLLWL